MTLLTCRKIRRTAGAPTGTLPCPPSSLHLGREERFTAGKQAGPPSPPIHSTGRMAARGTSTASFSGSSRPVVPVSSPPRVELPFSSTLSVAAPASGTSPAVPRPAPVAGSSAASEALGLAAARLSSSPASSSSSSAPCAHRRRRTLPQGPLTANSTRAARLKEHAAAWRAGVGARVQCRKRAEARRCNSRLLLFLLLFRLLVLCIVVLQGRKRQRAPRSSRALRSWAHGRRCCSRRVTLIARVPLGGPASTRGLLLCLSGARSSLGLSFCGGNLRCWRLYLLIIAVASSAALLALPGRHARPPCCVPLQPGLNMGSRQSQTLLNTGITLL